MSSQIPRPRLTCPTFLLRTPSTTSSPMAPSTDRRCGVRSWTTPRRATSLDCHGAPRLPSRWRTGQSACHRQGSQGAKGCSACKVFSKGQNTSIDRGDDLGPHTVSMPAPLRLAMVSGERTWLLVEFNLAAILGNSRPLALMRHSSKDRLGSHRDSLASYP